MTDTRARILRTLREGAQQAQEVAHALGTETSAAYRHLEALRADGLVVAETSAAGPGRPKKRYRLSEAGQETFPRHYAFLLTTLLSRIEATEGREAMLQHLAGVAEDLARPVAALKDESARTAALVALYNGLDFEAEANHEDDRLLVVQRNCPFLKAARDDPEALCRCLDEGILRAAFPRSEVLLRQTMARGDTHCAHEVRPTPRRRRGLLRR